MKKTMIALVALAGMASAESLSFDKLDPSLTQQLTYAWDFNTSTTANKGTVNWGSASWSSSDFSRNDDGTISIGTGKTDPWTSRLTGIGASWTVSLDVNSITLTGGDGNKWNTILSLYSNGGSTYFDHCMALSTTGNVNQIACVVGLGDASNKAFGENERCNLDTTVATTAYDKNTVTLVSDDNAHTLTVYVDGEQVSQQTEWNGAGITGFQFGACFSNYDKLSQGTAVLDNFYIFDSALSADQVKSLIAPEPATATLSLLALAGLAARRRRH